MSCGDTEVPAALEVKIVALKAKRQPVARNYGTPVPTMHVVFKMTLAIRKPLASQSFAIWEQRAGRQKKQIPRFARNDTFLYSMNLQLGTLKTSPENPAGTLIGQLLI